MPLDRTAYNESIKLASGALNTLATSSIGIGVLTPLSKVLLGDPQASGVTQKLVTGFVLWIATGLCLHLMAHRTAWRTIP
jgi:hypothetical protein